MKHTNGQILPIALVLILITSLFWVMIINVGMLIKNRIQLQIAADTSVQSACAIRARGLSSIGRLNSWLATPELGIGFPDSAWWPGMDQLQQKTMQLIRKIQMAYNRAYGGGWTAKLVRENIAKPQGADDIFTPPGSYSLNLQINHGPIFYLSTVWVGEVPLPSAPKIMEKDRKTRRWYEQGSNFHKKAMRLYAYRRASSPWNGSFPWGKNFFSLQMPDLYAVAAARTYNIRGPMFPPRSNDNGPFAGLDAFNAYSDASEHWQSQLIPLGAPYAH